MPHAVFPGPESPGKAKILGFVWLRGPLLATGPEGSATAGAVRWKPEGSCASSPPTPALEREGCRSGRWPVGSIRRPNRGLAAGDAPEGEPDDEDAGSEEPSSLPAPLHPKVPRLRPAASPARRRSRRPPVPHRAAVTPRGQAPVSSVPESRHLIPEGTVRRVGCSAPHALPKVCSAARHPHPRWGHVATPRVRPEGRSCRAGEPRRVRRGFQSPQVSLSF